MRIIYKRLDEEQSNLLMFGVKEGAEKNDTVDFVCCLLNKLLGRDLFNGTPMIEKAHRIAARNSARERPIIIKLLNYQNKVQVIHLAWERGELLFHGQRVFIYPDFSAHIPGEAQGILRCKKEASSCRDKVCHVSSCYSVH